MPQARSLFVEVDQRFGQGIVIDAEAYLIMRNGRRIRAARLRCDCGNEWVTSLSRLLSGESGSCGHSKRDDTDRTGERYGNLTIIKHVGKRSWLCKCDCGDSITLPVSAFTDDRMTCGCGKSRRMARNEKTARNRVWTGYRVGARRRGLSWDLTNEDFDKLTSMNCFYCGSPPGNLRKPGGKYEGGDFAYNGIDRVDSGLGYSLENVVACCRICNRAKMDMSFDEFIAYLDRISAFRSSRQRMVDDE